MLSMRRRLVGDATLLLLGWCALATPGLPALAEDAPEATATRVQIGDKVGGLKFIDIRFLPRALSDFTSKHDPVAKRAFVLIFTNTTCPLVQRYLPRLTALDAEFRDQGVQFVAVNVGPEDSVFDMATQAVDFDAPFPFVKDVDGACAAACGVTRTPEAVVIDADFRLRYRGRIDNAHRLGGATRGPVTSELRDAVVALLAGEPIAVAETPVDGCRITTAVAAPPASQYTYDHIAPLVEKHCRQCHRPGTAAPFSLLSFDDVASNAAMIAEVVEQQRMPPWYASAKYGEFTNARTMPRADRAMLVDWVRSGAPRGAAAERPEQPQVDAANAGADAWAGLTWQMGEPDLVVEVPVVYDVPADGYVDYKYALLPRLFLSETWLQGVEIQPSNPRVVHHANLGHFPIGGRLGDLKLITGYVPGVGPMQLEHAVAAKIPAGSALGLQIHLTTTGKPEQVKLRVGFRYPRDMVRKELRYLELKDQKFAIPPYASHHPVASAQTVSENVTLVGFFAHMHVRGKDMTFRACPPQGDPATLLMIPNYNFDWQLPYHLPYDQAKFPGGTRFECVAHYDNSTLNPYNPDPAATVRDGQQTFEEMMYGFVFYTRDDEQLDLLVDTATGQEKSGN